MLSQQRLLSHRLNMRANLSKKYNEEKKKKEHNEYVKKKYEKVKKILDENLLVEDRELINLCNIEDYNMYFPEEHILEELKGTKFLVSSTQFPGNGGAATNAYAIIKYLRSMGFDVAGVFFNRNIEGINYDPDNIGGIYLSKYLADISVMESVKLINKIKFYLKGTPDISLAKNYVAPVYCKEMFPSTYSIYLVSGINHFSMFYSKEEQKLTAKDVLNPNFVVKPQIKNEIICNKKADLIVLNSLLSKKLFDKIYPDYQNKIYNHPVDTTNHLNVNSYSPSKKEYDIVLCCSNFERKDKNNDFLVNILKSPQLKDYKKIIIGDNPEMFNEIENAELTGLVTIDQSIKLMSKGKVLLYPSLFDANSNTVREAYHHKCLPLINENVGYYENFPEEMICNNMNEDEWINKTLFLLDNYDHWKDVTINFGSQINLLGLLHQVKVVELPNK